MTARCQLCIAPLAGVAVLCDRCAKGWRAVWDAMRASLGDDDERSAGETADAAASNPADASHPGSTPGRSTKETM